MTKNLWQKNFQVNEKIIDFTVGNDYILDKKLLKYDCLASIVHIKMLAKIGILTQEEISKLEKALEEIKILAEENQFEIKKEWEDGHTAIESYLTEKLGDLGKKVHTFRSRNDQVLVALRLFYKDELLKIKKQIEDFQTSLQNFQNRNKNVPIPGYTHTRKAMPSSVELWTQSFVDSMEDNLLILETVFKLVDQNPLGTAAGYGVPAKIDRDFTTKELGFKKTQENPIYTQASRGKLESSILHLLTQVMFDLNKISTDLIMWSMDNFELFSLPKELTTGSSIMPQKQNPDVLELVRAKYHLVLSDEIKLKTLTANLISGYNRDLQLTKEPVMNSLEITEDSLNIMTFLFENLKVNQEKCKEAMTKELFATEKAYKLVSEGIPFRDAYRIVGEKFSK
jgi:argininosuccinate lyase